MYATSSRRNRHCGQQNVASIIRAARRFDHRLSWRNSMPSFTTICRGGGMVGVGAIAYKGWQLYGPPTEQVKSFATNAVDMAQKAWKNFQTPNKDAQPAAEARGGTPPVAQTLQPP